MVKRLTMLMGGGSFFQQECQKTLGYSSDEELIAHMDI